MTNDLGCSVCPDSLCTLTIRALTSSKDPLYLSQYFFKKKYFGLAVFDCTQI